MSFRTPIRLMAIVPVACAATLLAGCGSSGGGTTNDAAASHGLRRLEHSGGSSSGGSGVLDGIGHPVNVCSLIPAATAASVSGEPITVAQEQDTPSYKIWTCNYTSADGTTGSSSTSWPWMPLPGLMAMSRPTAASASPTTSRSAGSATRPSRRSPVLRHSSATCRSRVESGVGKRIGDADPGPAAQALKGSCQ